MECLKLISRPGCEKIVRYAFEYARQHNRKKVTCFTKDNIMKMTDGLFHKVFDEIAAEYPDIENEHWIVDIGAAKMADTPEAFDVIVMPNLYGDILSDVAAQIAGSVGLAGSANIGDHCAMFEAIHGSAPRRAGQNLANPSGLLLGAVLMLVHIDQPEIAERVHNAWLRTLEEGVHTYDIFTEGISKQKVGTKEFADAVIARLGKKPETLKAGELRTPQPAAGRGREGRGARAQDGTRRHRHLSGMAQPQSEPVGRGHESSIDVDGLKLSIIANRGLKVWPDGIPETFCTDSFRCRYMAKQAGAAVAYRQILSLLERVAAAGLEVVKTESLRNFDGKAGYTLSQGE